MIRWRLLASLAAVAVSLTSAEAEAQIRLYADGQLGLFGDARFSNGSAEASDPLEPSGGGVVGLELPILSIVSLGAEVGATSWNTDGGAWEVDPSTIVHASLVPRLRLPIGASAIYLAALVGPSFDFPSGDITEGLGLFSHADTGYGVHGGALAGVQVLFVDHVGFDLGAGYVHHVFWHGLLDAGQGGLLRVDLGQMVIRAGLVIAF